MSLNFKNTIRKMFTVAGVWTKGIQLAHSWHIPSSDYVFRVIVLGEEGSGKHELLKAFAVNTLFSLLTPTCEILSTRYIHNNRFIVIADCTSDISNNSVTKIIEINKKRIELQVSVLENNTLTSSVFLGTPGTLLLFNVADLDTFTKLSLFHAELTRCQECPVAVLVGVRSDPSGRRDVTETEAKRFAESIGLQFTEIALENIDEVNSVFEDLARMLLKRILSPEKEPEKQKVVPRPKKKQKSNNCVVQ